MQERRSLVILTTLVALAALGAGCVEDPPRPEPPAPVAAPEPPRTPPAAPPPTVPARSTTRPAVLGWRVGTSPRASILLAVPPYPASLDDGLPPAWSAAIDASERIVVLTSADSAAAILVRHGIGSARRDLREVIGEDPFTRLAARLGSIDGRSHRAALATVDARGALVGLVLSELGYRAPGEGVLEQILARAATHGQPVTALLDGEAFARLAESTSEEDVTGDLLERIANPSRTGDWADALRAGFESGDLAAIALACEEPARTESWTEATRRSNRELAASLADPVELALRQEGTLVVLDGCLLAGATGLVNWLLARGVDLTRLSESEAAPPAAPAPTPAPSGAPSEPPALAPSADPSAAAPVAEPSATAPTAAPSAGPSPHAPAPAAPAP